jgi:hypothetical protein
MPLTSKEHGHARPVAANPGENLQLLLKNQLAPGPPFQRISTIERKDVFWGHSNKLVDHLFFHQLVVFLLAQPQQPAIEVFVVFS